MLTRREFGKLTGKTALGVMLTVAGCSSQNNFLSIRKKKSKKPNLLFIFSDQQSRDTLSCYGNEDTLHPTSTKWLQRG